MSAHPVERLPGETPQPVASTLRIQIADEITRPSESPEQCADRIIALLTGSPVERLPGETPDVSEQMDEAFEKVAPTLSAPGASAKLAFCVGWELALQAVRAALPTETQSRPAETPQPSWWIVTSSEGDRASYDDVFRADLCAKGWRNAGFKNVEVTALYTHPVTRGQP